MGVGQGGDGVMVKRGIGPVFKHSSDHDKISAINEASDKDTYEASVVSPLPILGVSVLQQASWQEGVQHQADNYMTRRRTRNG
jgi:hypothetical protein